jgi:hypothetical protein
LWRHVVTAINPRWHGTITAYVRSCEIVTVVQRPVAHVAECGHLLSGGQHMRIGASRRAIPVAPSIHRCYPIARSWSLRRARVSLFNGCCQSMLPRNQVAVWQSPSARLSARIC